MHATCCICPPSRLRMIPMGVDLSHASDRATARHALGLPDEGFVVGFVGRLAPQKNPLRLARVFHQVAKARPDIRLVIVGDGELREVMEQRLEALGLLDATLRAQDDRRTRRDGGFRLSRLHERL